MSRWKFVEIEIDFRISKNAYFLYKFDKLE